MPHAVFLDTDIGTDIDDAYALMVAAVSPEIEMVGVSTVNNDTVLRARIARKLLNLLGRRNIPVVAGLGRAMTPAVTLGWMGHEGEGIDLSGSDYESEPLPELFRRVAATHGGVTLVTIGAMTNAAWIVESLGDECRTLIRRIVAMASDFVGYSASDAMQRSPEHNVACDPTAFTRVMESRIPITLVGLNVTRRTAMTAAQVDEIESIGGPLARALFGMHRVWFREIGRDSSPMHDALAVATVFRPQLITTSPVLATNPDERGAVGYYQPRPGQVTHAEIATDIDVEAYHVLFWERTLQAVRAGAQD